MNGGTLTIGEVAAKAGVNVQTLRYYERRGLLKEPYRHPSGHRQYPSDAVDFIRSIKQAQLLGFTLDEIEGLVALVERRPAKGATALATSAGEKISEVDAKIEALRTMRRGLEALVDRRCDSLTHCTCGKDCPVGPAAVLPAVPPPGNALAAAPKGGAGRRWLGVVPLAVFACLACFLPAILAGGAVVSAGAVFSALDAPADLTLGLGGLVLGAATTAGFFALRRPGGVRC